MSDMSSLVTNIMVLGLSVNSVKSSRTPRQATQFLIVKVDSLRILANLSSRRMSHSARPLCVARAPAEDARNGDDSRSSSPLGLDGTKGLSEVGYQPVAGSQTQQAETCPHLSERGTDSSLLAIQGIPATKRNAWDSRALLVTVTPDSLVTAWGRCVPTGSTGRFPIPFTEAPKTVVSNSVLGDLSQ